MDEQRPQAVHIPIYQAAVRESRLFSYLPQRPAVDLEFVDLSYTTTFREGPWWQFWNYGSKDVLKGLSGSFCHGELVGILGPSRDETSSFIDILAGLWESTRETGVKGQVLVNGRPRDLETFSKMSCYIWKEDILGYPCLTAQKALMVDEVLTLLGLQECAHTRAESLSKEQYKRLAIALEVVGNPQVMFLDEPTWSYRIQEVVAPLRFLASGGRTIICTIDNHGSSLSMFDQLYILSQGQCIYKGTVPNLRPYLETLGLHCPTNENPADFIIGVASGQHGDMNKGMVRVCDEQH